MTNLFLLSLFLSLGSKCGKVCDCIYITDEKTSKIVFNGKVIRVKKDKNTSEYIITFKVTKRIKGAIDHRRFRTYTPCLSNLCCGIPFSKGDYYYVVTREVNGKLYSHLCTTTGKLKN